MMMIIIYVRARVPCEHSKVKERKSNLTFRKCLSFSL